MSPRRHDESKSTKVRVPENLARRLRALALLGDGGELLELPRIPPPVQQTYVDGDGTPTIMRLLADAQNTKQLTITELLLGIHHLREHPSAAADVLIKRGFDSYAQILADYSFEAGLALSKRGRGLYADLSVDLCVNYLIEAERELLFAISSDRIDINRVEALGRYAVCVALSSRWHRRSPETLQRACEFILASIESGNSGLEAHTYLVELLTERFNQTGDERLLHEAISRAEEHGLVLPLAELLLKRGLLSRENGDMGYTQDFQEVVQLADQARVASGVEFVQRALVRQFALSGTIGEAPLTAREVRFPNGFTLGLDRLSDEDVRTLQKLVTEALEPMVAELEELGKAPNLVAQDVLITVLEYTLRRSQFKDQAAANLLVTVSALSSGEEFDRHLRWRHAEALLKRAFTNKSVEDAIAATEFAHQLVVKYPQWPLPRMTLARAVEFHESLIRNDSVSYSVKLSSVWTAFIDLVLSAPEYRRSDLGGRSSVFAIDDARGDLSTAFILKPVIREDVGHREAAQLGRLAEEIQSSRQNDRFGVPKSLGVFPISHRITDSEHDFVHFMERHTGRLLSDLSKLEAVKFLSPCGELLAAYHRSAGQPSATSGWKVLRKKLNHWVPALLDKEETKPFIDMMHSSLPDNLRLVFKRDAHAGNWVIEPSGRVIAIDLDGAVAIPVLHDMAQLLEDSAFISPDSDGFVKRMSLVHTYLEHLNVKMSAAEARRAYDWFALYRAIWLATERSSSKAQHEHARRLAQFIASTTETPGLKPAAEIIARKVKSAMDTSSDRAQLSKAQIKLSKAMSKMLRHQAPELGLEPDSSGFVSLERLACKLKLDVQSILDVATHPSDPRFQVLNGKIRALYGHSFQVTDSGGTTADCPDELYHGTSWGALDSIVASGILPQTRHQVHLSTSMEEAMSIGTRHGSPILLSVATERLPEIRSLADAVWTTDSVKRNSLRVRNFFAESASLSGWTSSSSAS